MLQLFTLIKRHNICYEMADENFWAPTSAGKD